MTERVGRLDGKRVVITGAMGGIGRAAARAVADEGGLVALVDLDEGVLDLAAELGGRGFAVDVTAPDAAEVVVEQVRRQFGGIDGLANIAGGPLGIDGRADGLRDDGWDRVLALNVTAGFRWIRASIPAMRAAGGGSIVNTSSIAGSRALPDSTAYVTSKAAVLGLTRSVAVDFGREGIRCNAITPGTIETPGLAEYHDRHPGMKDGLLALNFAGRFGTGVDVAPLFVYLLSDESSFVNGECIAVDGGRAGGSVAAREEH